MGKRNRILTQTFSARRCACQPALSMVVELCRSEMRQSVVFDVAYDVFSSYVTPLI